MYASKKATLLQLRSNRAMQQPADATRTHQGVWMLLMFMQVLEACRSAGGQVHPAVVIVNLWIELAVSVEPRRNAFLIRDLRRTWVM